MRPWEKEEEGHEQVEHNEMTICAMTSDSEAPVTAL